ncbi:MAG: class I SAM-dependent methyltransferase [Candidatus Methylacidiphilales bacterium]|nr:class I SAM-dependent methyltransferase [Candidatus Methylacidiphilales bacterium]
MSSNISARLHLLRIALTRRFIWNDVTALAREYGMDYQDVIGNTGPLDLAGMLTKTQTKQRMPVDLGDPEAFTPQGAPGHFHSEPSVSRFLYQLALSIPAQTIIELGCFTGWSTAHLALAIQQTGGKVWALDPCHRYLDAAHANLKRHQLEGWATWVEGTSLDPSVMEQLPPQAQLIFLDTSHAYPDTRDEILAYAPRLAPGGFLVLHDAVSAPGVRRSLVELKDRFDIHVFASERGHGVAVLRPRSP